jgi:transcriptional regulator with XRE-family HTH domain
VLEGIMKASEFIKDLVKQGVSQSDIARKVGISNGTITKYLYSETEPKKETIKKIATAYGKSPTFFLDDDFSASQPPITIDIAALAAEMAPMVARMLAEMLQGGQPSAAPLNEVERIKQQALILARQGKRAESIELMKSLSPRRRASHA